MMRRQQVDNCVDSIAHGNMISDEYFPLILEMQMSFSYRLHTSVLTEFNTPKGLSCWDELSGWDSLADGGKREQHTPDHQKHSQYAVFNSEEDSVDAKGKGAKNGRPSYVATLSLWHRFSFDVEVISVNGICGGIALKLLC